MNRTTATARPSLCAAHEDRAARSRVDALYRRFGPTIFARCRRLLRDGALAEDATQEVFVRVFMHLDRAPGEGELLGWMNRICTNYCLDLIRRRNFRSEELGVELEVETQQPTPETQASERDLVGKLFAQAAPKLREVAVRYHVDGLEQREVAEKLDLSRRTVITRLQQFADSAREFSRRAAA